MRVHFGFSLRLKNILKFLLPFAIGFLAYFGFNIMGVFALSNYNTTYNITIEEQEDLFNQTINGTQYTSYTLMEHIREVIGNDNVSYIMYYNLSDSAQYGPRLYISVAYHSTCEEVLFIPYMTYIDNYDYSTWQFYYSNSWNNSCSFIFNTQWFELGSNGSSSWNSQRLPYLEQSLRGQLTYNTSFLRLSETFTNFTTQNNMSYDITIQNYFFDSNITLVNNAINLTEPNYSYIKSLIINGNSIANPGRFIPYVELMQLGGSLNTMSAKLPYNYYSMNKSDLTNFNSKLTYTTLEPVNNFLTSLTDIKYNFYGRKNNSTYYSFEPINCSVSLSRSTNVNTNQVSDTYNNLICSSDLTDYDKIYIYQYYTYDYETVPTIYNSYLQSNVDSYSSEEYLGELFEPLTLQNGWKLLLSSNSQVDFNMISNNMYIARSKLNNNDISHISSTIVGEQIGVNRYGQSWGSYMFSDSFGSYRNDMLYLYDNVSYHDTMQTTLNLFFSSPQNVIYSFPTIINNEDTFTYYNNEGTLSNGTTIQTNYGNVGGNWEYSLSIQQNLNVVSDFINSISQDMYNCHILIQTFFDLCPTFLKNLIIVVYTLTLSYLIFKELKR